MSCRLVDPGTFKSRHMSEKNIYKMGDSVIQWSNPLLSRAFGFQSLLSFHIEYRSFSSSST